MNKHVGQLAFKAKATCTSEGRENGERRAGFVRSIGIGDTFHVESTTRACTWCLAAGGRGGLVVLLTAHALVLRLVVVRRHWEVGVGGVSEG